MLIGKWVFHQMILTDNVLHKQIISEISYRAPNDKEANEMLKVCVYKINIISIEQKEQSTYYHYDRVNNPQFIIYLSLYLDFGFDIFSMFLFYQVSFFTSFSCSFRDRFIFVLSWIVISSDADWASILFNISKYLY